MSRLSRTLRAADALLGLNDRGEIASLVLDDMEWIAVPQPLVEVTVQGPSDESILGALRRLDIGVPTVVASEGGLSLRFADMRLNGERMAIVLTVAVTPVGGCFDFRFTVENGSVNWLVRELRGPMLGASLAADPALIWPSGAGERLANPRTTGIKHELYPSRVSMPWYALANDTCGLYLGLHDNSLRTMGLHTDATVTEEALVITLCQYPFCGPGETRTTSPVVVRPYNGQWHLAADTYREWADTWWKPTASPDWVNRASGWQLAILRQQNGEIHWPYDDLDKLAELGAETGLDILGLFGWTSGGHDRHYPIYEPDPAMGGEDELRAGIARAQAAGQRVILYVNGQLLDMQREWYARHGEAIQAISERGEPFGQTWSKYHDAPPHPMACACLSCADWSDHLLAQAKKVHALGADGIIFDQLGAPSAPFCFSAEHGHDDPAVATGPGVLNILRRVQTEMRAIDPEFIVIVEHVTDGISQEVDLIHGCQGGFTRGERSFPELLRYTFPEIHATMRYPTPVMDPASVNWGCLHSLYFELEYRYRPDRLYVEQGIVPSYVDYEWVFAKPEIHWMRALNPRQANAYMLQVIRFARRHADLLRFGRFRDTIGFSSDNDAVIAKAYVAGSETGILIWNPTSEPQRVTLAVTDARFMAADAPGVDPVDPATPIPPNSLRLLRYNHGH